MDSSSNLDTVLEVQTNPKDKRLADLDYTREMKVV